VRRLDVRPQKKLRNPARHLRQLALWTERIVTQLPSSADLAGDRYWNFKVPVFAKVIEPPHATLETQRACLAAIFAAAQAIERSADRPANCRVACLVTTPFMFESEVTLFSDEDYFRSFLPVAKTSRTDYEGGWVEASPVDPAEIEGLRPPEPAGLEFLGGTRLREGREESPGEVFDRINWVWAFPRR
jgi:hypothetical protein